jgi:16S rRNA processing protein RimM
VTADRRELPDYLEIGRIIRPHGVRGEMVAEAGSDLLPGLASGTEIYVGPEHNKMVLDSIRPHRDRVLLKIRSIADRNQAEALRNQALYLSADQVDPLPDGEYYYWQIVGLEVFEESGHRLGVVKNIIETGANDVYVIESPEGKEILLPAIEQVILQVDLDEERMTVRLLPGLL